MQIVSSTNDLNATSILADITMEASYILTAMQKVKPLAFINA